MERIGLNAAAKPGILHGSPARDLVSRQPRLVPEQGLVAATGKSPIPYISEELPA